MEKLPQKLQAIIEKIIQNESLRDCSVKSKKINPNGGGFMGDLYEVDLKGIVNEDIKEVNLFIKQIISNAEEMTIYSVKDVFAREALAYNELSVALDNLQIEAKIPVDERFKMVKNYGSEEDVIVLQNMTKKGYKMNYRMDVVSLKYAELSIIELARFHALSLVLERKRPKYFDEVFKCLKPAFIFGKLWDDFANNISVSSIKLLDDGIRDKYEDKILDIVGKYESYITDTDNFNTLCHGDYKHNNVMCKETDGVISEVITIDYQQLHYGCPINDLLYFIFNGTDREFRKKHMDYLKTLYYDTMKRFLVHFNIDLNDIIPRTKFDELFIVKLDFGLAINCFYVPFLFAAEDDVPDVTESLGDMSFKLDPRFGIRFRELVDDFIEWGYL